MKPGWAIVLIACSVWAAAGALMMSDFVFRHRHQDLTQWPIGIAVDFGPLAIAITIFALRRNSD
jgi:hypothetical protein